VRAASGDSAEALGSGPPGHPLSGEQGGAPQEGIAADDSGDVTPAPGDGDQADLGMGGSHEGSAAGPAQSDAHMRGSDSGGSEGEHIDDEGY